MQIDIQKYLKKGFVFTGKWFTGVVLVTEVKEDTNELEVMLKNKVRDAIARNLFFILLFLLSYE